MSPIESGILSLIGLLLLLAGYVAVMERRKGGKK